MIMIKMIKTRIPIAMGKTPPRMPFASSIFYTKEWLQGCRV